MLYRKVFGEPYAKETIKPKEEQPIEESRRSFWGRNGRLVREEYPPLLGGLDEQEPDFNNHRDDGDDCKGLAISSKPKGSRMGRVKEQRQEQVDIQYRGRSDTAMVLGVRQ